MRTDELDAGHDISLRATTPDCVVSRWSNNIRYGRATSPRERIRGANKLNGSFCVIGPERLRIVAGPASMGIPTGMSRPEALFL